MNREEKIGYVFIGFLIALFIYCVWAIADILNKKPVTYEYAIDGQIYTSDKCKVIDDVPYCYDKDGFRIVVDNYYEK